jgi:hypothetical protein
MATQKKRGKNTAVAKCAKNFSLCLKQLSVQHFPFRRRGRGKTFIIQQADIFISLCEKN